MKWKKIYKESTTPEFVNVSRFRQEIKEVLEEATEKWPEGYMKDYVYDGMLLTMHGEVTGYANMKSEQGKTLMLPSVKADCITFIVIEK